MKVKVTVEYEVKADHELNRKEQSNVVGMLVRHTRNRLMAFRGKLLGGDHVRTGWEVVVTDFTVEPVSKT